MMNVKEKISKKDIYQTINAIANEINLILNNKIKEKYFYGIILLYSFIENILKYLSILEIAWMKSDKYWSAKEEKLIDELFINLPKRLTFEEAIILAFSLNIVNFNLYERIKEIKNERNNIIHQFWTFQHRKEHKVLRKKLEKLALVSNQLVGIFNKMTKRYPEEAIEKIFKFYF